MNLLTSSQRQAITARGNVLVVAGAGTGKTSTVVARCLRLLFEERRSLHQMLLVTFTEAAAAEMRQRMRDELLKKLKEEPANAHVAEQTALLDTAHLCTLHSFCLRLVSDHFHELGIDPQVSVLDEQQTQPLIEETLEALFQRHYAGTSPLASAFKDLVRKHGRGSDERIRALLLRLHAYTQSLPDPARWMDRELARFREPQARLWLQWLIEGVQDWAALWIPVLRSQPKENENAHRCARVLERRTGETPVLRSEWAATLAELRDIDAANNWPEGKKGLFRGPIKKLFDDAEFLACLLDSSDGTDPLQQDWDWARQQMITLLELAREFTADFSRAKRDAGGVDFADLEQFALRLLREPGSGQPTTIAQACREQFAHVFVDEYQDINAAQDAILAALSREGEAANRFLVGDVKQSIYRFRLANPRIFRRYEEAWRSDSVAGRRIALSDNFRSREGILEFVNGLFGALMRPGLGGVAYDADAALQFGDREPRSLRSLAPGEDAVPCVEFHLLTKASEEEEPDGETDEPATPDLFDLTVTEKEARLVALRLSELKDRGHRVWDKSAGLFRPVAWSDMAVLLRSPANKVEAYAQEFHRAGVPLQAARGGFYEALEILDLLSLLQLLDNPLQDVPLLAVLRSPLVGLSLSELIEIRAHHRAGLFWTALRRFHREIQSSKFKVQRSRLEASSAVGSAWRKADCFLRQFNSWRELIRLSSLSHCLECVLAQTHYEALLLAGERGAERVANVRRFLSLARQYDPFQRQGLFRFLRFIKLQHEAEVDHEPAPLPAEDAVQLMSIHKSKGLEFPVVAVADLGKRFNLAALREDLLWSEDYGLCPSVVPPGSDQRYPSLALWLARQRERRELLGEELRLLYVATTRARDRLILTAAASDKDAAARWEPAEPRALSDQEVLSGSSGLDWLRLWLPQVTAEADWRNDREGASRLLRWKIYSENDPGLLAAPTRQNEGSVAAPASELSDEALNALHVRLEWQYPFAAATVERAKTNVTELRRRQVEEDEEAHPLLRFRSKPQRASATGQLSAAEAGTAHHLFLQWISLDDAGSEEELRTEAARLQQAGVLTAEQVAALEFGPLTRFWQSDLGRRVRERAERVARELPFTARFSPEELRGLGLPLDGANETEAREGVLADEFVVVQGVCDLVVQEDNGIWLVDFKTDEFREQDLEQKTSLYASQLRLYGRALEKICRARVKERWLHFLKLNRSVAV
jgi:ATP-dependent helicase/nuclease subunit A